MKIYLTPQPGLSRAMTRVAEALTRHLPPGNHIVKKVEDADLEVIHVIDWADPVKRVAAAMEAGRRYAMIQYCFKSTAKQTAFEWRVLWRGATTVWSYYDLQTEWREDGACIYGGSSPNFYYAPLGIDAAFQHNYERRRHQPCLLVTTGYVAESECLQECADACAPRPMIHIGPDLPLGEHVIHKFDVFDDEMRAIYQASRCVAGLRRGEGFELPAYEGLACGARPIVFYAPHYYTWLGDHALYVEEDSPTLVRDIRNALETYRPVTSDESKWVREFFDWQPICEGFWERAL